MSCVDISFDNLLLEEFPINFREGRSIVLQKLVWYLFRPSTVVTLIGGSPLQGKTRWVKLVLSCHRLECILIINIEYCLHSSNQAEWSFIHFEDSDIVLKEGRRAQRHIILRMSDNLLDVEVDVVQLPAL